MHALLIRQLRRHLGDALTPDPRLQALIAAVDEAYREADADRTLLEHSLNLAAVEMQERYRQLQLDAELLRGLSDAQEERFKAEGERDTFFQMSSDLLCITDFDGKIRQVNQSWTRVLGYPPGELMGLTLASFAHPDDVDSVQWVPANLEMFDWEQKGAETRMRCISGGYRDLIWSASCDPVSRTIFATARDITDSKLRAIEATQAQKLQAVGQLAAGVAHEINTPIQYLGDNAEFLRQTFTELGPLLAQLVALPAGSPLAALAADVELGWLVREIPKAIDGTREGIHRVAELVRALKEFAHPDAKEKTLVDLNRALSGTITVARNELKYVADVTVELGPLPLVLCHGGSLNQVFLNLLVNAAHAITDAKRPGRGTIKVTSRLDREAVVVAITDSGIGIPDAIRHRIFEPFFTTKEVGRGTGQGLALARAIVDKHDGTIGFDSTVGTGSTFWVRLPIALPVQEAA